MIVCGFSKEAKKIILEIYRTANGRMRYSPKFCIESEWDAPHTHGDPSDVL